MAPAFVGQVMVLFGWSFAPLGGGRGPDPGS